MQGRKSKRAVVGYLEGKGGDETRRSDETKGEVRALFSALRARLDCLEADALALDEGIAEVGRVLRLSQPGGMYREMSVRWWKTSGHSRREPVLCRLEVGGKGGRLKVVPAKRGMRLRRDRGFGLGADIAALAVESYWVLKGLRDEVKEVCRVLEVEVQRGASRRRRAGVMALERLKDLRGEMVSRLEMLGVGDGVE